MGSEKKEGDFWTRTWEQKKLPASRTATASSPEIWEEELPPPTLGLKKKYTISEILWKKGKERE